MPWEHRGNTRSIDFLNVLRYPETVPEAPGEPQEDPQETTPREPRRGPIWGLLNMKTCMVFIELYDKTQTSKSREREARQMTSYERLLDAS